MQAKQDELLVIKEGTAQSKNPADNVLGGSSTALTTKTGCTLKAKPLRPSLAAGCMVNRCVCFYVCVSQAAEAFPCGRMYGEQVCVLLCVCKCICTYAHI
jgi:hypothetical protein